MYCGLCIAARHLELNSAIECVACIVSCSAYNILKVTKAYLTEFFRKLWYGYFQSLFDQRCPLKRKLCVDLL